MGDPFWPPAGKETFTIVNYCFKCPVRQECGDKGDRIKAESGIWGGKRRSKS